MKSWILLLYSISISALGVEHGGSPQGTPEPQEGERPILPAEIPTTATRPKFLDIKKQYVSAERRVPTLEPGIWTGQCAHWDGPEIASDSEFNEESSEKSRDALLYVLKDKEGNMHVVPFSVKPPIGDWVKSSIETGKPQAEVLAKHFDYKAVYEQLQAASDNSESRPRPSPLFTRPDHMQFLFPRFSAQYEGLPPLGFDAEQKRDGGSNLGFLTETVNDGKRELIVGMRLPNTASVLKFPKGAGSFCKLDTFLDVKKFRDPK